MTDIENDRHPMPVLSRLSRWLAWLGGGLILLSVVPITIEVITRKILNQRFFESYEITTYMFAVAVALGYGYALLVGAHIRVDVVYARLPRTGQALLDVVAYATLCVIAATLAWFGIDTALQSHALGARANSSMGTPLVVPQTLWAMGLVWFAFVAMVAFLRIVICLVRGDLRGIERIRAGSEADRDRAGDGTDPSSPPGSDA